MYRNQREGFLGRGSGKGRVTCLEGSEEASVCAAEEEGGDGREMGMGQNKRTGPQRLLEGLGSIRCGEVLGQWKTGFHVHLSF